MFPSQPCAFDQSSHPTSVTAPLPIVSVEFSPTFNVCDIAIPPYEFPDLVHFNTSLPDTSLPDTSLPLVPPLEPPIVENAIPLRHSSRVHKPPTILEIITVILSLLQSWPLLHSSPYLTPMLQV